MSKHEGQLSRQSGRLACAFFAGMFTLVGPAGAQLAITEMMSKSAETFGQTIVNNDTDFWELTNFGTNTVNLAGYRFTDDKDSKIYRKLLVPDGAPPLFIRGGESVIFARDPHEESNESYFREWWGLCLGSNVQVRFYEKPGFSSYGDSLSLYGPDQKLVDRVTFGDAWRGRSFVYDAQTGEFSALSTLGEGGACRAATTDDIASPGVTTGPIPLRIVHQPASISVCAGVGVEATFNVTVAGLPRPRTFQWFFNSAPLPGETEAKLTLAKTSATNEGLYQVSVDNGFTKLLSEAATLTVNTTPTSPKMLAAPVDSTVVVERTARFAVSVCAFPLAHFQWLSNGIVLEGATNRTLFIPNCTLEMSGSEFCVRAQNELGTQTACARLYVMTQPDLRFTEVQAYPMPGTNCPDHHDWFELTNFGTNAVDLLGYRVSDKFTLVGALVVKQSVLLQPRESVVFLKNPTAGAFVDWWGPEQLPPGLQLIPYGGMSLSKDGDELYLWNASAEDPNEVLHSLSFESAFAGVSWRYDSDLAPFGVNSVPGEFGAFRAVQCGDLGSPGYTTNPPPRIINVTLDAEGAQVDWRAIEGKSYRLEYTANPLERDWIPVGTTRATKTISRLIDPGSRDVNARLRFYRIVELAP